MHNTTYIQDELNFPTLTEGVHYAEHSQIKKKPDKYFIKRKFLYWVSSFWTNMVQNMSKTRSKYRSTM